MTNDKKRVKKRIRDAWGVYDGYLDSAGIWRKTDPAARAAVYAAMKQLPVQADQEPVRVIRAGNAINVRGCEELILEDGSRIKVDATLPPDLPVGYHDLYFSRKSCPQRLIVTPRTGCYLPADLNAWGWSVQVYALRSGRSWGIGDMADLCRFAKWSAGKTTAQLLMINPLCAAAPVLPQQASPYYPTSRLFRNPLYLPVEKLPGAVKERAIIAPLAAAARKLNDERIIDRDAVFRLKMTAFERLWNHFRPSSAFERYRAGEGEPLESFATYCVLAEQYGANWHTWPARFRRPESIAVRRFAGEYRKRVCFHQWLQWLMEMQLEKAGQYAALIADLPVGFDPGGADAWRWQDVLATDVSLGAPPDSFNQSGQDWGLQPFIPRRLREAKYQPFIESLRAGLKSAGGLRIDHVMGLFRLFWIPQGHPASRGVYVAYPSEEMLAVLAVESYRHRAFVIGEDLGTVEASVRRQLARRQILGCAVMWFERQKPCRYRLRTLASITTHDLPTLAGLWSSEDIRIQRSLGLHPSEEDIRRIVRRLCRQTGLSGREDTSEVIRRVHQNLAQAASMLRMTTLDDTLGVSRRPNMPGITAGYPSWSLALPVLLEGIPDYPPVNIVASAMAEGSRIRKGSRQKKRKQI